MLRLESEHMVSLAKALHSIINTQNKKRHFQPLQCGKKFTRSPPRRRWRTPLHRSMGERSWEVRITWVNMISLLSRSSREKALIIKVLTCCRSYKRCITKMFSGGTLSWVLQKKKNHLMFHGLKVCLTVQQIRAYRRASSAKSGEERKENHEHNWIITVS